MATGTLPTGIVCTTVLAAVLIWDTVPSPLLATHTSLPVTVTAAGSEPTGIVCTTAWVAGLIRDSGPLGAVHGPDRAVAVGQARRAAHHDRGAGPSPRSSRSGPRCWRAGRSARPPTAGPRRRCTRPRRPRAPSRWPAGGGRAAAPRPAPGCPRTAGEVIPAPGKQPGRRPASARSAAARAGGTGPVERRVVGENGRRAGARSGSPGSMPSSPASRSRTRR